MDESVVSVVVGGMPRAELMAALDASAVRTNHSAATLLACGAFDDLPAVTVRVVERTVHALGFAAGAGLPAILAAGAERGLTACPFATGPYLRLAITDQRDAPDTVMSNGHAPSGSVTVASPPWRDDPKYARGFYLRAVNGVRWLRGYHCTPRHVWSPDDRFAFALSDQRSNGGEQSANLTSSSRA